MKADLYRVLYWKWNICVLTFVFIILLAPSCRTSCLISSTGSVLKYYTLGQSSTTISYCGMKARLLLNHFTTLSFTTRHKASSTTFSLSFMKHLGRWLTDNKQRNSTKKAALKNLKLIMSYTISVHDNLLAVDWGYCCCYWCCCYWCCC